MFQLPASKLSFINEVLKPYFSKSLVSLVDNPVSTGNTNKTAAWERVSIRPKLSAKNWFDSPVVADVPTPFSSPGILRFDSPGCGPPHF